MEEQKNTKRLIAYKVRIKDLLEGKYFKEDGWQPNYIIINDARVSRVNIIGTAVSESEDETSRALMIDDGSGKIDSRNFEKKLLKNIPIGSSINVIGRVREFGRCRYIIPETVQEINPKWCGARRIELQIVDKKSRKKGISEGNEEPVEYSEETIAEIDSSQKIIELVRSRDSGSGVDIEEVAILANTDNAEKVIQELIANGELFEVCPGRIKVLE